jgi:hypothetical protein
MHARLRLVIGQSLLAVASALFAAPAAAQYATEDDLLFRPEFGAIQTNAIDSDGRTVVITTAQGGPGVRVLVAERNAEGDWVPDAVQPVFVPQQSVQSPNGLGICIAIDGDTIALGVPFDSTLGEYTGKVMVYERGPNGFWTLASQFTSPDAQIGGRFGFEVDLRGDRLAVGAIDEDGGTGIDGGAVHLFERSGGSWTPVATLTASAPNEGDEFGRRFELGDDRIAVAAPEEYVESDRDGAVYVFDRQADGTWLGTARLDPTAAPGDGDRFARSVALDGDRIAVGSFRAAPVGSPDPIGRALVFELVEGVWELEALVEPSVPNGLGGFGSAVDIEGDRLAVGDYRDVLEFGTRGSVHVFERAPDGVWVDQFRGASDTVNLALGNDRHHVVLTGDTILMGDRGPTGVFRLRHLQRGRTALEAGTWGAQKLFLRARPEHAFDLFILLGSASGTGPTSVPGLPTDLPLANDGYTRAIIDTCGGPLRPWLGVLDAYGRADSRVVLPPLDPSFVGLTLHHAFIALEFEPIAQPTLVSNSVPLTII